MVDEGDLSAILGELARTMATDSSPQQIVEILARCIVQVIPSTSAGITLPAHNTAPQYLAGSDDRAFSYEELQSELGDGPFFQADDSGERISVLDLRNDVRFSRFSEATASTGLAAVFTFPLRHDCDALGAMTLYRNNVGALEPQHTVIAQTLADVTAAYLVMARARDDARAAADCFKQLSLHDPLTGLPNRRLLEDRIQHAAQHARRSRTAVAVLFADLDEFKQVNDAHGHGVGDELLVAVTQRLSKLLRSSDTLARAGGDEFVFLCEDLSKPEDADLITERIADALAIPIQVGGLELSISASVGIAYAGASDTISADLISQADAAMYAIKRSRCVPVIQQASS
ncbi:MAG: sensor domain-containing diguanylate cyclase [Ilumatobacteraceae bacterium]